MSAEDLMARIEQARSGLQTSRGLLSDARGLLRSEQIESTQEGLLESIGRHTGDFFNGASDVVEETVSDLWNTITDPVGAIEDTVYAIQNPGEVWEAIKEPYQEAWNDGRPLEAIGRGVLEVGPALIGGAGAVRSAAGAARRSRGNNRPSSNDGAEGDSDPDNDNQGENGSNENGADANHTQPSGQEGGVPTGNPAEPHPNDRDPENIRALDRENESAVILARAGYRVEQLEQRPVVEGEKNPDYNIEGRIFDNYAPRTPNARNIASHIERYKVESGQADRIVLNLNNSKVDLNDLRNQFNNYPIQGLREVIVVKNEEIIPFFP